MDKKEDKNTVDKVLPFGEDLGGASDIHNYAKPSLTVDCVVFGYDLKNLNILLLKRAKAPFEGKWALPGGFLNIEETFTKSIERVLATKTGIANLFMEQLYTFDEVSRDERGRVISVAYFALVNPKQYGTIEKFIQQEESTWFPLDELPELAFDHAKIVAMAKQRLQNKVRYQPIGFELLDKEFTISELQRLYEAIVGYSIDRRNFRKKMLALEIIQPTGEKRAIGGHRSPDVYVFNKVKYDELVRDGMRIGLDFKEVEKD